MAKWADYGISRVRYNTRRTHIDKVEVRADREDSFGVVQVWTRDQVVSALNRGTTFVTILIGADDTWDLGEKVTTVTVNREEYIRTDQNQQASDNLGSLPEF